MIQNRDKIFNLDAIISDFIVELNWKTNIVCVCEPNRLVVESKFHVLLQGFLFFFATLIIIPSIILLETHWHLRNCSVRPLRNFPGMETQVKA